MSYEPRDASLSLIGASLAVMVFLVAASIGLSSWYYHASYRGTHAVPSVGRNSSFTHGPEERIGTAVDYERVTQAADEHLHSYGWVDEKAGVARIPIERAIELAASGVKPAAAAKEPGQVP